MCSLSPCRLSSSPVAGAGRAGGEGFLKPFPREKGRRGGWVSGMALGGGGASPPPLGHRRGAGAGPSQLLLLLPHRPAASCLVPSLVSLSVSVCLLSHHPSLSLPFFLPSCLSVSLSLPSVFLAACPFFLTVSASEWACTTVLPTPVLCASPWVSPSLSLLLPPSCPGYTHCPSIPAGTGCGWTAAQKCLAAWTSARSRPSTARTAEITSSR